MKKRLTAIVAVLLALAMCLGLVTACAPDEGKEGTTYTVTFDANGGTLSGNATVEVEEGEKITGAPTASKSGSDFDGWFTAATAGDEIDLSTYTVTADVTLYAQYTTSSVTPPPAQEDEIEDPVTITFDAGEGTLTGDATVVIERNTSVPATPTASREGYWFLGWFTKAEGGKRVNMMYATFADDTTVFAQYTVRPEEYLVTFDANGGTLEGETAAMIKEGSLVTSVPSVSKEEATFLGWFDAATGGTQINFNTFSPEENTTLYAQFRDWEEEALTIEAEDATRVGGQVGTASTASGGKYAGSFNAVGNTISFAFEAKEAGEAEIIFFMASVYSVFSMSTWSNNYMDQTVSADNFSVTVNDEAVEFDSVTLRGSGTAQANAYWDAVSIGMVDVVAGNNTVVITVEQTGGSGWFGDSSKNMPNIDRMEVRSDALVGLLEEIAAETPGPDDPGPDDPSYGEPDIKVEAETGKVTGTVAGGTNFIETGIETASGNSCLGSLATAGNTVELTFTAEEAGTGELVFFMSSTNMNWMAGMTVEDQTVDSSVMSVSLNGEELTFEAQTIRGSGQQLVYNMYWDPVTMGQVDIKEGSNTVLITVKGQMPNFDYMGIYYGGASVGGDVALKIEAENTEAVVVDGEISSNDGSITSFIETGIDTASGKASLGYLGVVGNTITFTFESTKAGKGELVFYMTSNNTQMDFSAGFNMWVDDQTVDNTIFSVKLNGTSISFEPATLRGAGQSMPMTWNYYWDPVTMGEVDIKEGENTVVIEVLQTSIPNIDYMVINSSELKGALSAEGAVTPTPGPEPEENPYEKAVTFDMIVGPYAGGPAIEKAVLHFEDAIAASELTDDLFAVSYTGQGWGGPQTMVLGQGSGQTIYLSDADGNKVSASSANYVTIEYTVSYGQWSFNGNLSPFTYQTVNTWNDSTIYSVDIGDGLTLEIGGTAYTTLSDVTAPTEWIVPDLAVWDLTGTHTEGDITLTYGSYGTEAMKNDGEKNPLIIWLHGAGEGGTDPSVAILGNQVTNLAKEGIQKYFTTDTVKGAYVLAAQTPTAWMDKDGSGVYGTEEASQYYVKALKGLIDAYIEENGDIDMNRIYIGGCSNGGFMTVNMIINYSDFFAAAYPVCEAYDAKWLTDEAVESIKDLPIWFTHSANDNTVSIYNKEGGSWTAPATPTTPQDAYTNNLYIRLINAGAENVHYSLFETVNVDGVNYDGHWSWIYTLRDECVNVQPTEGADGDMTVADLDLDSTQKVQIDGKDVTLWGWLAAQVKAAA